MNTVALPLPSESLFAGGRGGACVGALALVSLLAFEAMAVAAAMPAIAQALDGMTSYALAFGGMLATSVLGMVLAGWTCDRHGARRATLFGLLIFTAGLLLAGAAQGPQGMRWLVAGRIVQGLGGGMLGVALYVGMGQLVPSPLHPRLFAAFAAAWVLPGLLGPPLAAALVGHLGWRSVFLGVAVAVPLAAALLLPPLGRLPAASRVTGAEALPRARIGWAALAALGALLLHAASQGGTPARAASMLLLGLGVAAIAARRLLPRGSLSAARGLPAVIALRGLLAAAFATAEVFVPLYLTHEAGWSLAQAGLALSAGAVLWSAGSAVQARLTAAPARRRGLQAGFGMLATGLAIVALPMLAGPPAWIGVAGWALAGFGIGLSFPMLSVLTLGLSSPAEQGRNASALQLADALCCSAALAAAGGLFNLAGGGASGHLLVLGVALVLALAGALLSRRAFA
jgi:MFS family permease